MRERQTESRSLALFMGSQAFSIFGSMLVQYAIMWDIVLTARSGATQTLYILFGILPTFFLSPFAGVWADRHNRRKIIYTADAVIAAATLVLAFLTLAGRESLATLLAMAAIRALGQAVQNPAVGAYLPRLVPKDKLTAANAALQTMQTAIMLVAPMASGALMTVAPLELIFFIDVGTAAVAITILAFFLREAPKLESTEAPAQGATAVAKTSYFHDLKEGIAYIRTHAYLKTFFLYCTGFFFFAAPCAFLTPLQVTRSFGEEVWRLTAIEVAFSAGMMGGGITIGAWGGFKNRIHTMALASFMMGAFTLGLGLVPNFWVYLAFMALIGVSMPLFNTPATVLIQEKVEPEFLGRVFGVMGMISSIMMPAGMLVFGPLADTISIETLLVGSGAVIAVLGFFLLSKVHLE